VQTADLLYMADFDLLKSRGLDAWYGSIDSFMVTLLVCFVVLNFFLAHLYFWICCSLCCDRRCLPNVCNFYVWCWVQFYTVI